MTVKIKYTKRHKLTITRNAKSEVVLVTVEPC